MVEVGIPSVTDEARVDWPGSGDSLNTVLGWLCALVAMLVEAAREQTLRPVRYDGS